MNIPRPRQRSASHSSLHNAYRLSTRPITGSSTVRPSSRRPPLRSVNENSALLRSSGPLESMLKTKTETGDIGIFSINAGSSASTKRPPLRTRPSLDNDDSPLPSAQQHTDQSSKDANGPSRSYRDTTSEIISLYGSDNPQYWLRSASPLYEDVHRSYSLTTCSSRHIASQKSSGTLQSHSSSGGSAGMQRPRSPFPYPTRLKRPGVRPASPALAENGGIDYSRMIELNRVSQRTIYGSYKPTFPNGTRRPPPLSLRGDFNRSTASLPSRASPGSCYFGAGVYRTRTPSSSLSGHSKLGDLGRGSSTDPSVRSASLTSIVEMYQRPATSSSAVSAFRSGGSFYYDYSEAFEKPAPLKLSVESQMPICPIPTRPGSQSQPMVLRDVTEAQMSAAPHSSEPECVSSSQAEQQGSLAEVASAVSQDGYKTNDGVSTNGVDEASNEVVSHPNIHEDPADLEKGQSLPLALQHVPKRPVSLCSPTTSAASVTDIHIYATPSRVNSTKSIEKQLTIRNVWCSSKALEPYIDDSESPIEGRASEPSLTRPRCTLDPALSEFASLFSTLDRVRNTRLERKKDDGEAAVQDVVPVDENEEEMEDFGFPKRIGRRPSLHLFNVVAAESLARKRRHRRNAAALRISKAPLTDKGEGQAQSGRSTHETDILSPAPISPMRQLKVKNSIPQLMKALPPLPGDVAASSEVGADAMTEPAGLGTCASESFLGSSTRDCRVGKVLPTHYLHSTPETDECIETKSTEAERVARLTNVGVKPRLKLKLSRSKLGQARVGAAGKPFLANRLKQCNSLADLPTAPREFACADQIIAVDETTDVPIPAVINECSQKEEAEAIEEEAKSSLQLSDQFNIPYPPSPEGSQISRPRSTSTDKATLCEIRSFTSEKIHVGRRGLRQKLSHLRLRITGGLANESFKRAELIPALNGQERTPGLVVHEEWDKKNEANSAIKIRAESTRSEKAGGRMRRWASDAKQAVRSYVKRTLDRSLRISS